MGGGDDSGARERERGAVLDADDFWHPTRFLVGWSSLMLPRS